MGRPVGPAGPTPCWSRLIRNIKLYITFKLINISLLVFYYILLNIYIDFNFLLILIFTLIYNIFLNNYFN